MTVNTKTPYTGGQKLTLDTFGIDRQSVTPTSYNPSKTNVYKDFEMREKTIEKKLIQAAKGANGIALKLSCPGTAGMPDRLVLLPDGKVGFVEVKAPGEKPRSLQAARIVALRRLGFKVYVLDDEKQIGGILDDIQTA